MGDRPLNVLLVDDDKDDRFFFRLALTELQLNIKLTTANDGEALTLKLAEPEDSLPDLVFLDLNMPRKNGFECLDEIRAQEKFNHIFVAIYTTSISPTDILESYKKGANLYLNKPNMFEDMKPLLRRVFELDREKFFPRPDMQDFVLSSQPIDKPEV